jgi:YhcH/YjgK/YiaL family protein
MNRLLFRVCTLGVFCLIVTSCAAQKSGSASSPTDKEVNEWFNKKEWAAGMKLEPYADINKREFYIQYHKHPEWWAKTFAYLRDNDLTKVANGKAQLEGDSVFVSNTEAPDKDFARTLWESHRNYIDLQYIAAGQEKIMVADLEKMTVTKPYDSARDVANYSGEGKTFTAVPGTFYLFFPTDVHRPSIKVDDGVVKKVVVKIRYSK